MPGKGTVPGPVVYQECGTSRGCERHRQDRTPHCAPCRKWNAARSARYRKQRLIRGKLKIQAVGSHRRIRALMRLGWPMQTLEQRWGMGRKTLSQVLLRDEITREKAEQIARGYDRLAYLGAGPDQRTRMWAQRRDWPGPLDWDDIDNPLEVPLCVIEAAYREDQVFEREFRKMVAKRDKRRRAAEERDRARAASRGVAA